MRVGVIGIGFGQQVHIPAFQADPRCQVVALAASSVERASRVAARLQIPHSFGAWPAMLEQVELDAISIATPPALQPEIALAALRRGIGVFCEKPLANSAEQAHQMVQAADHSRLPNLVDFEFPEIAPWQNAQTILNTGGIGQFRHAAVSWNVETYANKANLSSWKTTRELAGGTLFSFVSHSFHYIEWLLGPIKRLNAKLYRPPGDQRSGDTLAALWLELVSGVVVTITASSDAFKGHGHRLEFYGDQGTLRLDNPTTDYVRGFQLWHARRETGHFVLIGEPEPPLAPGEDGRVAVVQPLVGRFITWLQTGQPASPTWREGARVQDLLEAARQSDGNGGWIEVPS